MVTSHLYCDNCGAANAAQAATCFACGKVLRTVAPASSPAQAPVPVGVAQPVAVPLVTPPQLSSLNSALASGQLLKQRYQILGQIGKGGFAAVYRAIDVKASNRPVAVKEVNPSGQNPREIAEASEAFQREAQLLMSLAHRGLPHIYDQFQEGTCSYLVMDFIEGETLEEHLGKARNGRLPVEEVLIIGFQLCDVLDYLHTRQQPIIFRDLKPGNIMVSSTGYVHLIDFGIARHFKTGQATDTVAFGSPGYAAPEQYGKAQTTPRSDIYSLGATLHQLLTGNDPTQTPFHFLPPSSYDASIPAALDALIMQMLEMNESKRPPDMDNVKWELQRIATQYRQQALAPAQNVGAGQAATSPQGSYSSTNPSPVATAVAQPAKPPASPQPATGVRPAWLARFRLPGLRKSGRPPGSPLPSTVGARVGAGLAPALASASTRRRPFPTLPVSRRAVVKGLIGLGGVAAAGGGIYLLLEGIQSFELAAHPPTSSQPVSLTPTPAPALGTTRYLVYRGHSATVDAVAWSPGVRGEGALYHGRIASGSYDKTVQVWDALSGGKRVTYHGHSSHVYTVAWSPDGRCIASGGDDKTVQVWEAGQGDLSSVYIYKGHNATVTAVAWAPDGRRIASGSYDFTVQVWEPGSESTPYTYTGHTSYVTAVVWSPDGKLIASGAGDNTVYVWDAVTGKNNTTYQGHSGLTSSVTAMAWSPDGKLIASGNDDGTVHVWSASTGAQVFVYSRHAAGINAVGWSPDGRRIASASNDFTVQVWNAPYRGARLNAPTAGGGAFTYPGHSSPVRALAWSPDGKLIASGSEDYTVQVWQAR